MAKIILHDTRQFMKTVAMKSLRRCANDLAVVQKQQVADAFKRGGQPSKKWPPLWADSFVGDVSQKSLDALKKANAAFVKAKGNPGSVKVFKAYERLKKAKAKATRATSYRKGGQRLIDAGLLAASFFTKYNFVFESTKSIIVQIASSSFYAKWQQDGFKTRGPNFIPLTIKAKREHQRGVNPLWEGLEEGVDYIMAWKGVKVPASPMIDYEDPVNKKEIDDTVLLSLKPR